MPMCERHWLYSNSNPATRASAGTGNTATAAEENGTRPPDTRATETARTQAPHPWFSRCLACEEQSQPYLWNCDDQMCIPTSHIWQ